MNERMTDAALDRRLMRREKCLNYWTQGTAEKTGLAALQHTTTQVPQ